MKTIFNVYSGSVFELQEDELKNLQEGEIPLERKPKASCKKCYGRGYIGKDKLKFIFQPCTQCIEKNILPGYEKQIVFNYIKFTAAPNVL
jgi:hypothetical protein